MAEWVLIFDNVTGQLRTRQATADHIAANAILSSQLGSGQIGGLHFRPGGASGNVLTDQGANAAPLFAAPAAGAAVTSGSILVTDIASGGLWSGGIASGTQELTRIAERRPTVELGSILISGTWDGSLQTVSIISGMTALEVYAAMLRNPAVTLPQLRLRLNALSGGLYHFQHVILGGIYTTVNFISGNSWALIVSGIGAIGRSFSRASIEVLGTERPNYTTTVPFVMSGPLTGGTAETSIVTGYYDDRILVSGLGFFSLSGQWLSGSSIKVFGAAL